MQMQFALFSGVIRTLILSRLCGTLAYRQACVPATQAHDFALDVKSEKLYTKGCVPIARFCFFGDLFNWPHHQ
jgi:hypothetical protein